MEPKLTAHPLSVTAAVILGSFLALRLAASTEPSSSRGFAADQVYHVNGIDTVNDFTGNLTATIPIGPTFRTNGSLTYAFTLRYASNLWDYRADPGQPQESAKPRWSSGGGPTDVFPALDFNAGLGWRVVVGGHPKRHPHGLPDTFVDSSGAEHTTFASPNGGASGTGSFKFTNDATYIRYHNESSTRTFEYPDGIREHFVCLADCSSQSVWWELDQSSDPYGDVLWVERGTQPSSDGGTWTWTYHEAVGSGPYPDHNNGGLTEVRTHTVVYTRDSRMTGKYRITSITLASAGPGNHALYTFDYTAEGIYRPPMHTPGLANPTVPYTGDYPEYRMSLILLTRIIVPPNADGTSGGNWDFDYIVEPDPGDYPNGVTRTTLSNGTVWASSAFSGLLKIVTLPTKGSLQYKYDRRRLPKLFCNADEPDETRRSFSTTGVRERAVYDRQGNLDGGRPWKYISGHFRPDSAPCSYAREQISATLDPFGNLDVSYFSIFMDGTNPGNVWTKYEWGLAVSKEEQDGAGRYLQSRKFHCAATIFDGSSTSANDALRRLHARYLQTGETLSCGDPIRTNWVQWESDSQYCHDTDIADCDQTNRRVKASAISYHDDGNVFAETINDQYDGFGHYRQSRTGGNFFATNPGHSGVTGGDERITFTGYNPGVHFSDSDHSYGALPGGSTLSSLTWVLNTYDLKKTIQGHNGAVGTLHPQAASVLYRFNAVTGFLERQRTLRQSRDCFWDPATARAACYGSNTQDKADLFEDHVRTQDGTSVTITSSYYGGDDSALTIGDLSSLPASTPDYAIRRVYRYGGLESVAYYNCGVTAPVLVVEQNSIDSHTGLVLNSQDDSGAQTTYTYDNLGRFKSIDPPGSDAETVFTYTAASSDQPANILATTGGTLLTMTYEFDHLGRVSAEKKNVPTGPNTTIESDRFFTYLVNGWKSSESTAGPNPAVAATLYQDYDPFGRPRIVLHPDHGAGNQRRTAYQYSGDRLVVETIHGVALEPGRGDTASTSRFRDRFGRLVRVTEASGPADTFTATRYEYDNLDHLVLVVGANEQRRRYTYDMRGFLTSEKEPELGGRTIRYTGYDARGNAKQRLFSAARAPYTPFDIAFKFDEAERLTNVRQLQTDRSLKELTYFPHGTASPRSGGKLQKAIRNNWAPPPTAPNDPVVNTPITQEFTYDASSGRMATRKTSGAGMTFNTSFQYDGLGHIATISYPQLSGCFGCAPDRTLTFTYKEGKLIAIPSYAGPITYAANGNASSVAHANGTTDYFEVDQTTYMARPSKIRTTFPGGGTWNTDLYSYDGAGNIATIGTDTYTYDQVNRLVKASLTVGGATQTQTYTYDANGNLNLGAGLTPDPSTNRLPSPAAEYDEAGNLKTWTDPRDGSVAVRTFDPFNLLTHNQGAGQGRIHCYDAADQRVAVFDYGSTSGKLNETWSIRGLSDEVLRDFTRQRTPGPNEVIPLWSWRDYVYRDNTLLAQVLPNGGSAETQHVHVDHLGSTRRISNSSGAVIESRQYLPYGLQSEGGSNDNRFKFTGHERDASSNPNGIVDYMHARYYAPSLGRFLSVDAGSRSSAVQHPQRWNRYWYADGNPINAVDPDGRDTFYISRELEELGRVRGFFHGDPILHAVDYAASHSFIATLEGVELHTYSWGDNGHVWSKDLPKDLDAAHEAFQNGTAEHVGDRALDPYVEQGYQKVKDNPEHANWLITNNCKSEAKSLVSFAYELQERARRSTAYQETLTVVADQPPLTPASPPTMPSFLPFLPPRIPH